jgi:hypothetical protein
MFTIDAGELAKLTVLARGELLFLADQEWVFLPVACLSGMVYKVRYSVRSCTVIQ